MKTQKDMEKKFKILSIDGGGIRGIYPAKLLSDIEDDLQMRGVLRKQIFQHFDLICGTSTGGIIAIALALGIPAKEILSLYLENAGKIFGSKKAKWLRFLSSSHSRNGLENVVRSAFRRNETGKDPRLGDCKTSVCIPIYDLIQGKPSILKTRHHDSYVRDFHIPAYQAALATAAAPTYFDPYSGKYVDLAGTTQSFSNKIDGGMVANNPALVGIVEAIKAFGVRLENLSLLSLGTGHSSFSESGSRNRWGLHYWMLKGTRQRLIEVFMQGQAHQVENLISLLHKGIDRRETENFSYLRIDTKLDETYNIELDDTRREKLERLIEKAHTDFQNNASAIRDRFIDMAD